MPAIWLCFLLLNVLYEVFTVLYIGTVSWSSSITTTTVIVMNTMMIQHHLKHGLWRRPGIWVILFWALFELSNSKPSSDHQRHLNHGLTEWRRPGSELAPQVFEAETRSQIKADIASLMRMRVIVMMMRSERMSILMVSKRIEFWEMIVDDVKDFWQSRDETAALVGMWEHMKLKWARKKSQILGELDKSANKFSEKISSLPYHQPSNGDSLKILPQYQSIFLHWCNANFRAQDINTNALKQNTHKKS